jgi:hypothetical protein
MKAQLVAASCFEIFARCFRATFLLPARLFDRLQQSPNQKLLPLKRKLLFPV